MQIPTEVSKAILAIQGLMVDVATRMKGPENYEETRYQELYDLIENYCQKENGDHKNGFRSLKEWRGYAMSNISKYTERREYVKSLYQWESKVNSNQKAEIDNNPAGCIDGIGSQDIGLFKEPVPVQEKSNPKRIIISKPLRMFFAWYKSYNIHPAITAAWVGALVAAPFLIWAAHVQSSSKLLKQYTIPKQYTQNSSGSGDNVGRDKIVIEAATVFRAEDRQAQIKIAKIKINRILEDLSNSLEEMRKGYLRETDKIASDYSSRNMITSGIFIKAQMDFAISTKEKIEKLITKSRRDIQDITLENFKAANLQEIPEFADENQKLSEIEKGKMPEIYKQFENTVKSWEMKALQRNQLTKDFKL